MKDLQGAVERVSKALSLIKALQHIEGSERDHLEQLLEGAAERLTYSDPEPSRNYWYCEHCGAPLDDDGGGKPLPCRCLVQSCDSM